MANNLFSHADCGGKLSLYAGEIYCGNCGHLPLDIHPENESEDLNVWLPHLLDAYLVDRNDFHGMARKPID